MRVPRLLIVAFLFVAFGAVARAEYRIVLIQIKKPKAGKVTVTIHSDDRKEQKKDISVDEAVKVIPRMVGWGSSVGVYVQPIGGPPKPAVKKVLVAVLDNVWFDLMQFGPKVPNHIRTHFLKAEPGK